MPRMNQKLGKLARKEIKESVGRCTNRNQRSAEVERLATLFEVSKDRIYAITREDRPKQKKRADNGKRKADLLQHEGLKIAASDVIAYNIDPAEAIRTAAERGYDIPVSLETFQRYLRDHGLNRKNRRMNRSNFRRFEAKAPGEVFQFDISGTKERWYDTKLRKLVSVSSLEVSKNHPNENPNRVKVWRFVLTDDHSRMRFIRYVAVDKPNSSHVVAFLMEAYETMGVPKILYTDNDVIIKFGRNLRSSLILNKALEEIGGYKLEQHLPGNSRATGKVEVAHQWVEKIEKLLGKFLAEGRDLTMEVLNRFAEQISKEYNHRVHRETKQTPIDRWNAQRHLVRTVDAKILKSAFLADEFEITILGDLTFKHKGVVYQLPHDLQLENLIARQSRTEKCKVIFPDDVDFFTLVDFDGNEYDIAKVIASPDTYGEYKRTPDDIAATTKKELKNFAKEQANAEKEINRQGFQPKPIAVIDTIFEAPVTNVAQFPKQTLDVTEKVLDSISEPVKNHVIAASSHAYSGQLLTFWQALDKFADRFSTKAECKEFLDSIFADREDTQPEAVISDALENRDHRGLRAVS